MLKILVVFISLVFPYNLYAADWVLASTSEDPYLWIDKTSIVNEKGTVKAWSKFEYVGLRTDDLGQEYNQMKSLDKYNCSNKTSATLQVAFYKDNQVISSASIEPRNISFVDIIPDSLGEELHSFVCKTRKK